MTITTEEALRMAGGCDIDNFPVRAAALRSLAAERDALKAENARLRAAICEWAENIEGYEGILFLRGLKHEEFIKSILDARAALGEKQ
jgi:hypothetical protein